MTSIASLLNPEPDASQQNHTSLVSDPTIENDRSALSPPLRQKKQKISKDAAVFTRGRVRGQLMYPPCEFQDEKLAEEHRAFEIHPMGHISEFPRHIPYNSEKKPFLGKTGRESFEVFQYEFKIPGEDKVYTVMWDYNIGLVRTTSLFRCNNYSKTAPAKVLNANPGLREICHSITGGALAAQGYWMPFEAAKAVAATFCWNIRYALTPLFGVSFLSECLPPSHEMYGRMIIDPAIIQAATKTAHRYRDQELEKSSLSCISRSNMSYSPLKTRAEQQLILKRLRPKNYGGESEDKDVVELDGTSHHTERASSYYRYQPYSTSDLPNSGWTPANTPRTAQLFKRPLINQRGELLPSPKDIIASFSRYSGKPNLARYDALSRSFDGEDDDCEELDDNGEVTDQYGSEDEPENKQGHATRPRRDFPCESDVDTDLETRVGSAPMILDRSSSTRPIGQSQERTRYRDDVELKTLSPDISATLSGMQKGASEENGSNDKGKPEAKPVAGGRQSPLPLTSDARAAYMLMKLHMQEAENNINEIADESQVRMKRRASA